TTAGRAYRGRSAPAESVDRSEVALPKLHVTHAETLGGGETEHADLSLVGVLVHLVGGLPGLREWVGLGEGRRDLTSGDEPVGLPRFAVVGEVRADDSLDMHPEVAVVEHVQEAARGRAGDDRATAAGDEDRCAECLPAGMLEDDVRILAAGQVTN